MAQSAEKQADSDMPGRAGIQHHQQQQQQQPQNRTAFWGIIIIVIIKIKGHDLTTE